MPEQGLWLAALLALIPAVMGDRTAIALLTSLLYACALEWLAVPFNPMLWALADLAVLAVVVREAMTIQDELVCALFLPAWFAYFTDAETCYVIGLFVVILQLLIVLPWPKLQRGDGEVSHGPLRRTTHGAG